MAASGGVWVKTATVSGVSAYRFVPKDKLLAHAAPMPKSPPLPPGNYKTDWDEPHWGFYGRAGEWGVARQYLDASEEVFSGTPTYSEEKALEYYVSGELAGELNHYLWTGKKDGSYLVHFDEETLLASRDYLDHLIARSPVPFNVVAKRQANKDHSLYGLAEKLQVGDIYASKGYDSTSLNMGLQFIGHDGGGEGVTITYRVPKGAKALFVPSLMPDDPFNEAELLFARGLKWRVVSKTSSGYKNLQLTVEYAGEG
jgi:hypothetical protein